MSVPNNLTALFEVSIRNNWDNRALSDYGGSAYTYKDVGTRILDIHSIFRKKGIKKGDKIFVKAWATDNISHNDITYKFVAVDTNGILAIVK